MIHTCMHAYIHTYTKAHTHTHIHAYVTGPALSQLDKLGPVPNSTDPDAS